MKLFHLIIVLLVSINCWSQSLQPFNNNGLWGFKDIGNRVIIQAKYNEVRLFSNGFAKVSKGEKWGMINEKGIETIPADYEEKAIDSKNGLIVFAKNSTVIIKGNSLSVFNTETLIVHSVKIVNSNLIEIQCTKDSIYENAIETKYFTILIDSNGKELGRAIGNNNFIIDSNYILNYDNEFKILNQYGVIKSIEGVCKGVYNKAIIVKNTNSLYGAIDINGNQLIPNIYYGIYKLSNTKDSILCYQKEFFEFNFECGYFLNNTPKKIIQGAFVINSFNEGSTFTIFSYASQKEGIVDMSGQIKVEPVYDLEEVKNGIAIVNKESQLQLIDFKGNNLLSFVFYEALFLTDNYLLIKTDSKYTIVDISKNEKSKLQFDGFELSDGLIIVSINNKKGVIDYKSNFILNPEFDSIEKVFSYFKVKNNQVVSYVPYNH